jgi:predicted dehydrogenase
MQCFGVGIIGYGFMGKAHAYGHLNIPLFYDPEPCHCKLIGVADSIPASLKAAQQALNLEYTTTDWRALIERSDIDIIHVCTPNNMHKDQVIAALQAGKHVYVDKPLCMNVDEAKEIEAVLPSVKTTHGMALNSRFFAAAMRAKELVEAGFLGEPLGFRAGYMHAGSADPNVPLKWKLDPSIGGGGVLFDLGSHIIDLIQHLLGPLQLVNCTTHVAYPERPLFGDPTKKIKVVGEDSVLLTMRAPNGAPGHIEATKICTGAADSVRFEINGSKGALRFDSMQPNYLEAFDLTAPANLRGWCSLETVQNYGKTSVFPPPKMTMGFLRAHTACLYNFLVAVAEGRPADPGLEAGIRLQYQMAEAYEYAKRGQIAAGN